MWSVFRVKLTVGSADKTAKRYDRITCSQEIFQHPDFVKDIVVSGGFAYTACSDENIRQWSLDVLPFLGLVNRRP